MKKTGDHISILLFVVLALGASDAFARPQVEAKLGRETIGVGERTTYTLTIRDAQGGELSLPRFGELTARGPSKRSQSLFELVNGQQKWETAQIYTWEVESPTAGVFLIGPAVLETSGEKFASNAVELTVDEKARQAPQAKKRRNNPFAGTPFDDPFDAFDAFDAFGALDDQIESWTTDPWGRQQRPRAEDVFVTAIVDKNEAFLGEQVTLSLYLMSRVNISGVQNISFPKLDGFWSEDIESPTQLVPEPRTVNGVQYSAYLLRRRALFPIKAGTLPIEPVEAQVNLGVGLFLGARTETLKRRSKPVDITVKPLPAQGQPQAFESGHVGSWSLSSTVSETDVTLGQPVKLRLVISGRGNIKNMKLPRPAFPEGLRTYDPTVEDKPRFSGTRYGGTRTAEWVVVPERTGAFTIPPVEFRFFDPETKKYRTESTKALTLNVTAGDSPLPVAQAPGGVSAPVAANVLATGVRPVRVDAVLVKATPDPWKQPWFWPVTAGPVAAWLLLLGGTFTRDRVRARDPRKLKERRARAVAEKRLKLARERLAAGDAAGVLTAIEQALVEFLTDRLSVPARGLTRSELGRALDDKAIAKESVDALVSVLEACDTARYMPGATEPSALGTLLDRAADVLGRLETGRGR